MFLLEFRFKKNTKVKQGLRQKPLKTTALNYSVTMVIFSSLFFSFFFSSTKSAEE